MFQATNQGCSWDDFHGPSGFEVPSVGMWGPELGFPSDRSCDVMSNSTSHWAAKAAAHDITMMPENVRKLPCKFNFISQCSQYHNHITRNLTNNEFSWMAGSLLSVLKPKAWPFRNAWQVQQTAPKCTKI